ncbi:MAG: hypothetical protein ACRDWI_10450 [Jiangellaceae bacterium]
MRPHDVQPWLTLAEIRSEVADRRSQRPEHGVYVAHSAELTTEQERWVCLLAAPPGSALAGLTAAELDGFEGFGVPEVHLSVPVGSRRPRREGLHVTYSTHLGRATSIRRGSLPVPALRAAWSMRRAGKPSSGPVEPSSSRASSNAVFARTISGDALSRRGPCKQHALIAESIDDAEGGIASVPEREFEQIRRRFGLPVPDRQAVVRYRPGGRYHLDVDWNPYATGTEIHGTQHLQIRTWDADLDRHNVLTAGGRRILQFSSYAVRHRQEHVGALVTQALRSGGWR